MRRTIPLAYLWSACLLATTVAGTALADGDGSVVVEATPSALTIRWARDGHSTPDRALTLRADCDGAPDGWVPGESFDQRPRSPLPWTVYAVVAEKANAWLRERSQDLLSLAALSTCPAERAWAFRQTVERGSLLQVLTDAFLPQEEAAMVAYAQGKAAGALPASIPRTATPPVLKGFPLVVTHASRMFDSGGRIAPALDEWISDFKGRGQQVIYLMSDDRLEDSTWLTSDRSPTAAVASTGGEHQLALKTSTWAMAGGYWSLCLSETVSRAAASAFEGHKTARVIGLLGALYEDPHALRRPGHESSAISELLDLGREITLRDAWELLGPWDFAQSLRSITHTALQGSAARVSLYLDGKFQWSVSEKGPKGSRLQIELWSKIPTHWD
ncbi:MAG TPA: hypothetical protein VL588_00980 [Bdellovibrionota bacterium]|nr:hypothetical protein [Bdellovibrionota bacterium]